MAKQRFQPNTSKVEAPLIPDETQEEQQKRLKTAVDAVQKVLRDYRAVIAVNNIRLVEGRMVPEISIQVLK
jgi:hypothetical protein